MVKYSYQTELELVQGIYSVLCVLKGARHVNFRFKAELAEVEQIRA